MPSLLTIKQSYSKDKKSSLAALDFLKLYFKENLSNLSLSYPGIREKFFIEEFEFFSKISLSTSVFDEDFTEKWTQFLECIAKGVPLEYINKRAYFFESFFYVDERVLIPRFETEILIEYSIAELTKSTRVERDLYSICEVGVGPGTIGLSLLKNFKDYPLSFHGIDISEDALKVARINEFRLKPTFHPAHEISLSKGDRLEGVKEKFNLIVSNPPYIKKEADKSLVHKMVLEHEPAVALFLEDDLYENWFVLFFKQVNKCLKNSGLFLMEGHESHLVKLSSLCENVFNTPVEIINDLSGVPRLLKVRKDNG